ncbi:MAG: biopolymer transporter ExbD [Ignavibacteriaceae bacterium]|nr:biopolymer transporter ExbD [Ignavibacteriaceae bacterium]
MRRRNISVEKEFSEINITPFTDVILVLLIIFMITSPFIISGSLKIDLPQSLSGEGEINRSLELFLTAQNEIFVNDQKVKIEELPMHLQIGFFNKGTTEVIIKADKNVLHGNFVKLLDILKQAGATKLTIATTKIEKESKN